VVSTPASYSGGTELKSRPGDRLSWLRFFVVSLNPPGKCQDRMKIKPRPIPSASFPIHLSLFHSTIYILSEKESLNELQTYPLIKYVPNCPVTKPWTIVFVVSRR
jgi:hypothetical protein